jgi:hypothetical protein
MRRFLITAVAVLALASRADALTIRDVIELSRAGLGEDVLLALIDVDRGVYDIDTATLKSLKDAGVPEKVIVALVRSGRDRAADPPVVPVDPPAGLPPAPEPQVVVIDHHQEPRVREVVVPVPVYIPVDVSHARRRRPLNSVPVESTYVPFQSGPPLHPPQPRKTEPVYWGFGGKLRPDAWKPDGHVERERDQPSRGPDRERR